MKLYLYLIACLFMLHACRSPETLVEKGKYDLVLKRASRIFKRKKPPSTKWVMAAEEAFALANEKDLKWIEECQKKGGIQFWKKIYYTARKIDNRQKKLAQYMPIVAKTGYTASFDFIDSAAKLEEATSWIANLYFAKAKDKMQSVKAGSKKAALHTIALIDSAQVWREDIYQAQELRQEAVDSAMVKVALYTHYNEKFSQASIDIETYLHDNFNHHPKPYLEVAINPSDDFESDYYFFVYPTSVFIGNEYESVEETDYSKEIVTGCETVKEWNETDSIWVTKTIQITEIIYGTLVEYEQSKDASMQALISVEDAHSYKVFHEQELNTSYSFWNTYSQTYGNEKAISAIYFTGFWESYPSDWRMESYMSRSIAHKVKRYIKKYNWWFE